MRKGRWDARKAKQYRDIGIYTIIPTMMIVGPLLGYAIGRLIENKWDHAPWPTTGGAVFGLAAAVRQIWVILKRGGSQR